MARILIVDDEPDFRMLLGLSLSMLGHEVKEADTGERALRELQHGDFQLVLLDMRLPGIDGLEVVRRLAPGHPPVAMMSAHADDRALRERALAAGCVEYLSKPFDPQRVDELVARHGQPDPQNV